VTFRHGADQHQLTVTGVLGVPVQQSCADLKLKPAMSFVVAPG
jgi:hypothetical protein